MIFFLKNFKKVLALYFLLCYITYTVPKGKGKIGSWRCPAEVK